MMTTHSKSPKIKLLQAQKEKMKSISQLFLHENRTIAHVMKVTAQWRFFLYVLLPLAFYTESEAEALCSFAFFFVCFTAVIGKKVEVSLRLFDIFKRNRVFIFLYEMGLPMKLTG